MMIKSKQFLILIIILLLGGIFVLLTEHFFEICPNNLMACSEQSLENSDTTDDNVGEENPDSSDDPVACTMDAKQCPDGSFVGRVGPDCEFAECPAVTPDQPVASTQIECSPESRNVDACIEIYQPVCGAVRVECFTTPCNPVPETFGNSCFACMNDRVISYTEGECAAI